MIRVGPRVRRHLPLSIAALAMLTVGCKRTTGEVRTVGPAEPAERAATSFVHCVEAEGGGCVKRDPKYGSWDAFALLQWLGAGSPTSILQALQRELEHHRNPMAVQERFVVVTARYREPLRGAECRPESATPLAELLPKLTGRVETRMQELGLWRDDLANIVGSLAREAEDGLSDGWLVHMTCYSDPFEIWVATAKHDERQVVVGMLTSLPSWLGGGPLDDDRVEQRISGGTLGASTTLGVIREGTIDTRWLPITTEEF